MCESSSEPDERRILLYWTFHPNVLSERVSDWISFNSISWFDSLLASLLWTYTLLNRYVCSFEWNELSTKANILFPICLKAILFGIAKQKKFPQLFYHTFPVNNVTCMKINKKSIPIPNTQPEEKRDNFPQYEIEPKWVSLPFHFQQ